MTNEERDAQIEDIKKNHPDRLLTCSGINLENNIHDKEKLFEIIKEARSKGYIIKPAENLSGFLEQGIVMFKEIDGIELVYNPRWRNEEFCYSTEILLAQSRCSDFWMDDVGDIALKATELIQTELAKYGIKLEDKEEDLFYVPIFNALENFSNGNYRSEM